MSRQQQAQGSSSQLAQRMDLCYDRGELEQAMEIAQRLLERKPKNRSAMERVASLFIDEKRLEQAKEAVEFLAKAFPLNGYLLFLQCRVAYMELDYEGALALAMQALARGDTASWQTALLHNITARMYREVGEPQKASQHYLAAIDCENNPGMLSDYSNYLMNLHYWNLSREELFTASKGYERFFAKVGPYVYERMREHEKLRIGYISPDLRFHVVLFFSYALFKNYDRNRFEVYAYANCKEDSASEEIAASIDGWRNIRLLEPAQTAKLIYEDEIDILVELAGHTADNCLPVLAYRPAPVQICGIGYFNTTGLPTVDYFLADFYTDPPGLNDEYFTERLLRLPHSHFCYMWHDDPLPCPPAPFRENGFVTFGSLNNFAKVTDDMLRVWARILERVPKARLFLKAHIFNIALGWKKTMERMEQAGIPLERVTVEGASIRYLDAYGKIDIALDTYPYPGGGTTCDALYMGVPVITLVGRRHNARFGYSLLMNLGLSECCAESEADYVEKAVALAKDPERLKELHQTLRRRMLQSPVMDAGLYMTDLESGYLRIWREYEKQLGVPEKINALDGMKAAYREEKWEEVLQASRYLQGGAAEDAEVCAMLGEAYCHLSERRYWERAAVWLKRATEKNPKASPWLWGYLGDMRNQLWDAIGAYEAYAEATARCAKEAAPDQAFVRSVLGNFAKTALQMHRIPEAVEGYRIAAQLPGTMEERAGSFSSFLLAMHHTELSSREIYEEHLRYGEIFQGIRPFSHAPERHCHKRIRVGYVSPDFRGHVMFSIYYGFLACYDKSAFEVTCYQKNKETDAFTKQLQGMVDWWQDVSEMSCASLAKKIYGDEIDILVDLAGHTANSGLPAFAWKPAPVQVSGLGYLNTTGLDTMDYLISDTAIDPPGMHDAFLSEKPLYLPSQFCYTGRNDLPASEGAPCRKLGYVTFGVFNQYRKFTGSMFRVWQQILEQLPDARLLMKGKAMGSNSLMDEAYREMRAMGFDMDRVCFEPASLEYMERYLEVDIALDTYPYPGGGTTLDALYMGVPVISLYGERRNTRFGLSILRAVGLEELAAATIEEYIGRAVALARDRELLDILHRNLRQMVTQSDGLAPRAYTRYLEKKYLDIWQEWQEKQRN